MSQEEDLYRSNMTADLTPEHGEMPEFEPHITPAMQAQIESVKDPTMREVTRLVMNLVSMVKQETRELARRDIENNGGLRKVQLGNMKKKTDYKSVLIFLLTAVATGLIAALLLKWIHP